jgi:transcriptional regulator with XRE-family HTH domain
MDEHDDPTPAVLGQRLRAARDAKGMTLDAVIIAFDRLNIPESLSISRGKIGQMEKGYVQQVDPFDLLLLATIYDKEVADFSPQAAADLESYRRIVSIDATRRGEVAPDSPCSPDLLGAAA